MPKHFKLIVFILLLSQIKVLAFSVSDTLPRKKKRYIEDHHHHVLFFNYALTSNISNAGWRNFCSGYNAYTKPLTPLSDFKNLNSLDIGYRVDLSILYGGITWQHTHERCEATFDFNEKRRFDYYNNTIILGLGFRIFQLMERRLRLHGVFNIRFGGHSRIESSYIYRNGFQSYGSEKDLNGTYINAGTLGNELGLNLNFRILKGLRLEFLVLRQSNNSVAPSIWGDISNYKTLNSGNFFGMIQLPQDYELYMKQGGASYNGEYVRDNFRGFKTAIGISYTF